MSEQSNIIYQFESSAGELFPIDVHPDLKGTVEEDSSKVTTGGAVYDYIEENKLYFENTEKNGHSGIAYLNTALMDDYIVVGDDSAGVSISKDSAVYTKGTDSGIMISDSGIRLFKFENDTITSAGTSSTFYATDGSIVLLSNDVDVYIFSWEEGVQVLTGPDTIITLNPGPNHIKNPEMLDFGLDVNALYSGAITDLVFNAENHFSLKKFSLGNYNVHPTNLISLDIHHLNAADLSWAFSGFNGYHIKGIENLDLNNCTSLKGLFIGATNLTDTSLIHWNTSGIEDMSWLFAYQSDSQICRFLPYWNLSSLDNASYMFYGCDNLETIDIYNDIQYPVDATELFGGCSALTTVNGLGCWWFSSISGMFDGCTSLETIDLSPVWLGDVEDMSYLFNGCTQLTSVKGLSRKDTSSLTNMSAMFSNCPLVSSVDLGSWDVSNVTDMSYLFYTYYNPHFEEVCYAYNHWGEEYSYYEYYSSKLTNIYLDNWDTSSVTNMYDMFYGCDHLTSLDVVNWDTQNVESMGYMFAYCKNLSNIHPSGWNTSKVTDMSYMFETTPVTSLDLTNWNTSNVSSIAGMFNECTKLQSLGMGWQITDKVTDLSYMFNECSSLTSTIDVSGWNTSNVTDLTNMFRNCSSVTTINGLADWDTGKVTSMKNLFCLCKKITNLDDIANWDTSNVTSLNCTFHSCKSLSSLNINNWDVSKVTDFTETFNSISPASIDLSKWKLDSATSLRNTFRNAALHTVDSLASWDTSNITDMYETFFGCASLTSVAPLSSWNTSKVTTMHSMFLGNVSLESISPLDSWDTSNVVNMCGTFASCDSAISANLTHWNVSKVLDMSYLFSYCEELTELNLTGWDTSNVTDMTDIFITTSSLTSIEGIANWDVSKVRSFWGAFAASGVTLLNLANWKTSNMDDMAYMFTNALNLSYLNLTGWYTKYADSFYKLFYHCVKLKEIVGISDLDTSNLKNLECTFLYACSLESLDLHAWNTEKVYDLWYTFCDCKGLKYLNLSGWDTNNVRAYGWVFNGCHKLSTLILGENFGKGSNFTSLDFEDLNCLGNDTYAAYVLSDESWNSFKSMYNRAEAGLRSFTLEFSSGHAAQYADWDNFASEMNNRGYTIVIS